MHTQSKFLITGAHGDTRRVYGVSWARIRNGERGFGHKHPYLFFATYQYKQQSYNIKKS